MTANPRTNTPRPRTVTVTEQDVRRLAAIIYHDTVLLTQAFEFSRDFLASLPDAPTPEAIAELVSALDNLIDADECRDDHQGYFQSHGVSAKPCVNETARELIARHRRISSDATPSAPEAAPRGELPTRGAFLARVSELCTSHPDCLAAPFSNHIETAWRLAFLELQGAIP
jgi:hypothetical protein